VRRVYLRTAAAAAVAADATRLPDAFINPKGQVSGISMANRDDAV
jgi:hypothetical protein